MAPPLQAKKHTVLISACSKWIYLKPFLTKIDYTNYDLPPLSFYFHDSTRILRHNRTFLHLLPATDRQYNCSYHTAYKMENQTKKRKSFIDVRRISVNLGKMFDEEKEDPSDNENSSLTKDEYLTSLKEERLQWKDILHLRQKQLENLKSVCSYETAEITVNEAEKFLSHEDKMFLNDEPNYLGMIESANKYLEAVDFFKRYKSDVIEHYDEVIEEIGNETNLLVKNLCDSDICDLCNQQNCTDSSHRFPKCLN
ncbi:UNVERIFIED_CONTAM: hypothetical protein PYX00_007947 [Menopon gallinae]|uniref:Uncharacterized protein n=1 Tax=Menopon gallinae TaxID=328185 RepID=A0AAW2HMF7_9NEOP